MFKLRRRLKDVIYPHTLKRLSHSPFLKLKPHLYQNSLSSKNDKEKLNSNPVEDHSKQMSYQTKSKLKNAKLNKCITNLNKRNKSKTSLQSRVTKKSSDLNTQPNKTACLTSKLNNQFETFNKSNECKNATEFNFCKSPYSVLDEFYF